MIHPPSPSSSRPLTRTAAITLGALLTALTSFAAADTPAEELFETHIRPVLVERCLECHGKDDQSGELRLDSRSSTLKGGEGGAVIVPGHPEQSRLIEAIRQTGDLEMPPSGPKLTDDQIAAFETWIRLGAPWPETTKQLVSAKETAAQDHWAFQPVGQPAIPMATDSDWVHTPIDAFVLRKLHEAGLSPSPEADRRTLIRRATYTLTGLPPAPEEVDAFVRDESPDAWEQLVDRLLESPHYGEQWARHWLDVARYSDTKGYVYAREERFWVHAWVYRDWVVQALNNDLPYDRFLLLQLAADQVEDRDTADLAAMGFLTLGRRFLGVERDIIDDRIDVVTRGTMGLTVGCARCHDHKYDPIPTTDYYALYGVFDSSAERLVPVDEEPAGDEAFQQGLKERQQKLASRLAEAREESSARARSRIADYLHAQTELHKYPPQGFDQIFQKSDLLPDFVRRWERYLFEAGRRNDPVFVPWHAFAELPEDDFAARAAAVTKELQQRPTGEINPLVLEAFAAPPATFGEAIDRYAALFQQIEADWQQQLKEAKSSEAAPPEQLPSPAAEQLRQVLYGPQAPSVVPDQPVVHLEGLFDSGTLTQVWKLQGEVDRWIINARPPARYALTLIDRPVPTTPRVFVRGNPQNLGEAIPRRFLSVLADADEGRFEQGSGRLELARAIIDPENPLTARVIVNRVWAHHFGQGLVTTPSDFGLRAEPPSHPQLLDWLTTDFVENGWSLKRLHRLILLSSTFRQSSAAPASEADRQRIRQIDPDNRLLSRMNAHRLTFEEFRDATLAATGELDLSVGGKPSDLFAHPSPRRRTLYGRIDRQYLPGTLRVFDFANPDLHTPQRSETTVPQQALFFLNDDLMLARVRALADAAAQQSSPEQAVNELFRRVLQREPTDSERAEALALVDAASRQEAPIVRPTVADWQYGYGAFDESSQRVTGFTALPHFNGAAWQGGPKWPDPKLGWVQLTADGGHPGNDRQHACVRRWTAPHDMTVSIRSHLRQEAAPGDGIRAFVVSSRAGLLQSASIHKSETDLDVDAIDVAAGETIDFLVDIGDVLNSDQYFWQATIAQAAGTPDAVTWDSRLDFTHDTVTPLNEWEQLAQVLLCTNEFLFVD
ncbi:PSD1 and planctomycete cytochrome C domain-containing protein [Maioricimonas rarisocia]|nr:PSD1 and planctomycete cytochrome C domain-containing protein [Maioricimonas rarisocia]